MVALKSTVHIVEDDPDFRDSLAMLFTNEGLTVEAHASAPEFLAGYDPERPGCLLLDMRLPKMSGLDLLGKLSGRRNHLPAIVLTGYGEVALAVEAMKYGAIDFIEKPADNKKLMALVRGALDSSARDVRRKRSLQAEIRRFEELTHREQEIFGLVTKGKPNRKIAETLDLSERTVEFHRANIMSKMKASSLAGLVRKSFDLKVAGIRFSRP